MTDEALAGLSRKLDRLYEPTGRRSISPEYRLRAFVIQILDWVRSERLLMEQIDDNLLFRWFVGFPRDERAIWDVTVFTKNRDRLLRGEVAASFFRQITAQARVAGLLEQGGGGTRGCRADAEARVPAFGWMKTVAVLRKLRHRGRRKIGWTFTFTAAVYDLVHMRTPGRGAVT